MIWLVHMYAHVLNMKKSIIIQIAAVKRGDALKVRELLEMGVHPNATQVCTNAVIILNHVDVVHIIIIHVNYY